MKFLKCVGYVTMMGVLGFLAGRIFPKKWFRYDSFLFKSRDFEEEGKLYDRFAIRKWKDDLPDMSRIFPSWKPSKSPKISRQTAEELEVNLRETCIAEAVHSALAIVGFGCLEIWPGIGGLICSLLSLLGNIPFVMVQRYNRPRFAKLYDRLSRAGA